MTSKLLAKKISKLSLEKKAEDVAILDIRKLTTMADYFVICSANSINQVKSIADHIVDEVKKIGEFATQREGYAVGSWIIIDLFDVVVHVFLEETRNYYNLEKLWSDAKKEIITDKIKPKKSKLVRVKKG
ncbi:MAG: ribosome silencing factor [Bacteroidetes bacterium]|nr:ribosome silencing factor [Bacteroidota bacterium]